MGSFKAAEVIWLIKPVSFLRADLLQWQGLPSVLVKSGNT